MQKGKYAYQPPVLIPLQKAASADPVTGLSDALTISSLTKYEGRHLEHELLAFTVLIYLVPKKNPKKSCQIQELPLGI